MTSLAAIARTAPPPERRFIGTASPLERAAGLSRALVQDGWVFVSGTTGHDHAAGTIAEDVAQQTHQALHTIASVLAEVGAGLADVVSVRVHLSDPADAPRVAPVLNAYFGDSRPAGTIVASVLIDPQARIEIDATARLP
ncbi:RidA family protein [Azospirillum griseum]|uniref:RidA family protein n=1 Tax=Azospirillum griseum TaxID=2496639 RepID=A0A3S0K4B5_9PROT|nr:RidA family protein [Azospirillum griseum]RTR19901.1 RidA family protein [Azospirillum griseum]